jgi:hypothetical protein
MIKMQHSVRLVLFGLVSLLAAAGCSLGRAPAPASATGPAPEPATVPMRAPVSAPWPVTSLHYAPNSNFGQSGRYVPAADGFNLADIDTDGKSQLDSLPDGVRGLVWLGDCGGATAAFRSTVDAFAGDPKLYGFYVMDEPIPARCPAQNLLAEDNWIHTHVPGAKTFAILENLGPSAQPTFTGAYTPRDCGLDLIGIDPYPVRSEQLGSPHYEMIAQYVRGAEAIGWPASSIVPVYQTFGRNYPDDSNGYWVLPTAPQERQILSYWAAVIPHPQFDYAYSWGPQFGDNALSQSPPLQAVFAEKNKPEKHKLSSTLTPVFCQGYSRPCAGIEIDGGIQ